jgi:hypothetical protein
MLAMFKALKSDGLDAVGGHKGRYEMADWTKTPDNSS